MRARHRGGAMSVRIALNTEANFSRILLELVNPVARSPRDSSTRRSTTKARMISMFVRMARLRRTLDNMATPSSVKANGGFFGPRPGFVVFVTAKIRLLPGQTEQSPTGLTIALHGLIQRFDAHAANREIRRA
jgi:hypothetical protein